MRIRDLTKVYIYKSDKKLLKGEYITNWFFVCEEWLNAQQDINELNRNSAGEIDYEIVKLRTDRVVNLDKGYGVSFRELEIDNNKQVINDKPDYIVENSPKIGKTTLYTLVTNGRE